MKKLLWITASLGLALALIGPNPFAKTVDAEIALNAAPGTYPNETRRLIDGTYLVAARTPMPGVSAQMVRWWFTDFLQTTEHYKWWHPQDHVWMDWENKQPGEIIGASHLVHEYIGEDLNKLRIQFVDPAEFFGRDPNDENTFVICARTGMLEMNVNVGKMCHIVVNTPNGAEMRSRFWLAHVSKRDGNSIVPSAEGVLGNTPLVRLFGVSSGFAHDLMIHAQEEMGNLAALLPTLYKQQSAGH